MTTARSTQLSFALLNFAATDPGDWQFLLDRARAADAAGVDRLVVSDHVVYGEDLEAYGDPGKGGVSGGRQPTGPDGLWLEPLTLLSVVAGCTTRIRLGTNILLAALRRPVVLAKSASTLDVLSRGRLDIGVGNVKSTTQPGSISGVVVVFSIIPWRSVRNCGATSGQSIPLPSCSSQRST
jgi:alkanesulfonate monooxygenase SsuD/methylene tetrahydromethanopterin reductase-like flavin-dependent oxidoreductase (luciferase family)